MGNHEQAILGWFYNHTVTCDSDYWVYLFHGIMYVRRGNGSRTYAHGESSRAPDQLRIWTSLMVVRPEQDDGGERHDSLLCTKTSLLNSMYVDFP